MTTSNSTQEWQTYQAKVMARGASAPDTSKFYIGLVNTSNLSTGSTIVDFVGAELLPTNGYSRLPISFSGDGTYNSTTKRHELPAISATITANGGSLQFQTAFLIANGTSDASQLIASVNPSTDRITINNHGFTNGKSLIFTADALSSIPSGISPSTIYKVANATTNDFQIQSSGSLINIADSGSGSIRARSADGVVWNFLVNDSPISIIDGQTCTINLNLNFANIGSANGV